MSQFTQQFLNSVLSQSGSAAPPYAEGMKWHIRQHLMQLTEAFPSLQPKTATFTHNDGRSLNLLQADGTVPMSFQGVTYNIPVIIWLMESYPHHAPLVFVNPTRDMIIKRPHPFVSPNGVVSIPYIHSWVFPSSNLVELARNLSHFFARDPPLYSQRKPSEPNPNPNSSYASMNSSVGSTAARPAIPPRAYSSLPNPTPPPPYGGGGRVMEDPAEVFRKNAINTLVESFNGDIREMRKGREGEMEGLFGTQAVLRKRDEELRRGLKEMLDEKEALEQQLQMVLMNGDILEGWLRENEGKLGGNDVHSVDVDVDEAFEPCDALSKQMLDCTALDMAVEDAIYSLDKAVQEGAVPFDQYMRNVRLLSREQFFHRAIGSKVRAIQMQAQVAGMVSRAPPQYAFS
ncbi:Ubiquitin-conjugating enzyme/RWD-like protein [Perilla frutescens var. hirtella]|nr:Ubiquitin-conjugating enzyme/RWD-like protein [Perilla frutescens var. hirtella]KAH6805668.1 Ubiquitin-conjugating enzyme/RWD-like protein [Perilla frutescens var. frutescens]